MLIFAGVHPLLIAMHRAARIILSLLLVTLSIAESAAIKRVAVVADSLTHKPLPRASVFNNKGVFIGTTASDGTLSCAVADDYPLTVRYIGYSERTVSLGSDTVFMQESVTVLPEMLVESRQKKGAAHPCVCQGILHSVGIHGHHHHVSRKNGRLHAAHRQQDAFQRLENTTSAERQIILPLYQCMGTRQRERPLQPAFHLVRLDRHTSRCAYTPGACNI